MAKRRCISCNGLQAENAFPNGTSKVCSACFHAPPAHPAAPPLPERVEEATTLPAEEENHVPTVFPHVEIDPSNPTHQELAARFAANKSLLQFIRRFRPKYQVGWVHSDICKRLEQFVRDVEDQKEPRLLLCMPVRHGKSEIASRHLPPWVLGKHPDWEIIATSGAQSLAMSFSRYQRDLMRDASYTGVFPGAELDPSSQSVENWNMMAGGGYLAAGVGTMITGRGAHILIVDDPVKDAEAADSQVIRDNNWEWFMSTAMSRLAPGGGVLIIMTWWNDDDLAGRVQQLNGIEGADRYEVVKYPAINDEGDEYIFEAEPGRPIRQIAPGSPQPPNTVLTRPHNTALHPDRYKLESLLKRKATYHALGQQRWWSALYQQDPTPADGMFFTKDMMTECTHPPKRQGRTVLQAWDFAITEKQKSDWTVGITGILDEYDTLYIVDVWRFKTDDGIELGTAICEYAQTWGANVVGVEDGQIWKSIKANFDKACADRKYYPSYQVIIPFTDKRTRAQPARGRMQQKKVQFHSANAWWSEFKKELLRFEAGGKHDDQVDALAHLVRLATSQTAPAAPRSNRIKSWKEKLPALMLGGAGGHMSA